MDKHTPTPLKVHGRSGANSPRIYWEIAGFGNKADAEKGLRAVNAHDELVRRLKETAERYHILEDHRGRYRGGYFEECHDLDCKENARALAKAEGVKP